MTLGPSGGDAFFRQAEAERLPPATDTARIAETAAATDLEFTGPPL